MPIELNPLNRHLKSKPFENHKHGWHKVNRIFGKPGKSPRLPGEHPQVRASWGGELIFLKGKNVKGNGLTRQGRGNHICNNTSALEAVKGRKRRHGTGFYTGSWLSSAAKRGQYP